MKRIKNWQKNLIAAAVLVVVCAGIYMNWMYNNAQTVGDLTDTLNAEKVMSTEGILLDAENVDLGTVANTGTMQISGIAKFANGSIGGTVIIRSGSTIE